MVHRLDLLVCRFTRISRIRSVNASSFAICVSVIGCLSPFPFFLYTYPARVVWYYLFLFPCIFPAVFHGIPCLLDCILFYKKNSRPTPKESCYLQYLGRPFTGSALLCIGYKGKLVLSNEMRSWNRFCGNRFSKVSKINGGGFGG